MVSNTFDFCEVPLDRGEREDIKHLHIRADTIH